MIKTGPYYLVFPSHPMGENPSFNPKISLEMINDLLREVIAPLTTTSYSQI